MITSDLASRTGLVLLLLCSGRDAYAYIDPGTGSLIIQSLLAAIAGAMVAIRFYWHRILTFFGFRKDTHDTDQDNKEE